ncbi:uncharacterized protein [Triticum aestivum]|uniref:uncharacterized protein n=1 Tax=Triticum aestivum TaxID=4565 RepID=UPI001D02C841|nr:uncharacterized protein LOC123084515 [Triticum aestivum]
MKAVHIYIRTIISAEFRKNREGRPLEEHSRGRRSGPSGFPALVPASSGTCSHDGQPPIHELTRSPMPPGGGEASKHGRTGKEQSRPPAIRRRDVSRPAPPFPAVASQRRKKRRQRQPATAAGSVSSEGPLVEILARLPYPSLCRFQCVSKQWRELCSDLIGTIKSAPQNLSGFFHNNLAGNLCFRNLSGGRPLVDASLPFLRKTYQRFKLQQCSTSLLLCKCWESEDDDEFDFVVCNPMTDRAVSI